MSNMYIINLMKDKKRENILFGIIWLILVAAYSVLVMRFQMYDCIDYDSSYQYFLNLHSPGEMFELLKLDYSPPLYAWLIKIYSSIFGTSLSVLRTSSLIIMAYFFYLLLFPLRRLMGKQAALLSAVMLLCSDYNIYFGHLIRPTLLGYVLTTGVFIYAALSYFEHKRSDVIKLSILSITSMYTHNTSLISAFCVYAVLCLLSLKKKNRSLLKPYLISGSVIAVLYVPWLMVTLRQLGNANESFWNLRMTMSETLDYLLLRPLANKNIGILALVVLVVILLSLLISPLLLLDRKKIHNAKTFKDLKGIISAPEEVSYVKKTGLMLVMVAVSFIAFYLFSYKLNIQTPRYFYVLTGGVFICFASLIASGDKKKILTILTITIMPISMICSYIKNYTVSTETEVDRLRSDISASLGDGESLTFYHPYENDLGITCYLFPKSMHVTDENTFTVLLTYDVFAADIRDLDHSQSIKDFTDSFYVFQYSNDSDYCYVPLEDGTYSVTKVGIYNLPYIGTEAGDIPVAVYRISTVS